MRLWDGANTDPIKYSGVLNGPWTSGKNNRGPYVSEAEFLTGMYTVIITFSVAGNVKTKMVFKRVDGKTAIIT